ncbi:metallophosphoesterase [Gottschalkia purinilytica]|uniref:Metallophosphoesterase n=1 Tax=Gottschalkia purinilytica TaxID=1503 RepID=A0A0L0W9M1_GOTPU|nr:metallophosphoesterase [Gottschalkia purinilytica]KNF08141.1 metallophosphoesterase [Gottschalkia purinilytica]
MSIYSIADLHLDPLGEKPMDIFGENWINHEEKIINNWKDIVKEDDLVLIPGDISWGLKLEDVCKDLGKIEKLPGTKIISKGNHDYWWQTKNKLNSLNFKTIHFLHNDSYIYNDIGICGARGWPPKDSDEFNEHDEKVFNREVGRLELSINSINKNVSKKIVMLHYPPFNFKDQRPNEFVDVMKKYNIDICIYGHLHGEGHKYAVEGKIENISFYCVSSDYIDFSPIEVI